MKKNYRQSLRGSLLENNGTAVMSHNYYGIGETYNKSRVVNKNRNFRKSNYKNNL